MIRKLQKQYFIILDCQLSFQIAHLQLTGDMFKTVNLQIENPVFASICFSFFYLGFIAHQNYYTHFQPSQP